MALQWRNLTERAITAVLAISLLVVVVLFLPKWLLHLVLFGLGVAGTWELDRIARGFGFPLFKLPVLFALAYGMVSIYAPFLPLSWGFFITTAMICLLSLTPPSRVEHSFPRVGMTLMASTYLCLALVGLGYVFDMAQGRDDHLGRHLFLFFVFLVWMGDSAAYLIGTLLGKHKVAKIISPNKTIEGTVANFAGNFLAAVIGRTWFFPELNWTHVVLLTAIFGVLGFSGDLIESTWKRGSNIKDSGGLFPGHGGLVDRADSIWLTAPVYFVLMGTIFQVF